MHDFRMHGRSLYACMTEPGGSAGISQTGRLREPRHYNRLASSCA